VSSGVAVCGGGDEVLAAAGDDELDILPF